MTNNFRIDSVGHDKTHGVDYVPKEPFPSKEFIKVCAQYQLDLLTQRIAELEDVLRYGLQHAQLGFPCLTVSPPIYTKDEFIKRAKKALGENV